MGAGMLGMLPQFPSMSKYGWDLMFGQLDAGRTNERYKSAVRHLRRREYQDQMYSMKKAGLNPILASGATPGHAAAVISSHVSGPAPGAGTAIAANRQATTAAKKQPAETRLTETQREVADLQRFSTAEGTKRIIAEREKIEADTKLSLQESGSAAVRRLLQEAQARREGVTAQKIQQEVNASTGGNVWQDPVGYGAHAIERGLKGADDLLKKAGNTAKEAYEMYRGER